jgi:hypothetical protein
VLSKPKILDDLCTQANTERIIKIIRKQYDLDKLTVERRYTLKTVSNRSQFNSLFETIFWKASDGKLFLKTSRVRVLC